MKNKEKSNEKKLTSRTSRQFLNSKKKTLVYLIQKPPKDAPPIDESKLPPLFEIINILKKTKKERSFFELNKLNDYLITKFSYFRKMRDTNDVYQYSRTLTVLKYIEIPQGKNIVTIDEEGDRCYIVLEGEISILKPTYTQKNLTMKQYVQYLKKCDKEDPSKMTKKRIIEKNNHLLNDVTEFLDRPEESLDDQELFNIFIEKFEKIFEAKDGFTFGEAALLHKQRRNATVRAEKFCKLIYIDKYDYNKIMKESEKKRIDEEVKFFMDRFYLFHNWGYVNMYRLYSLMTDIKLYKEEILYKQNDESDYIYFMIDGICEKYTYVSYNWKSKFLDYISDFSSNFFLRVNTSNSISYLKLMKIINEAKETVPESPMIFRDFNSGKCNVSLVENKDIDELILNKDDKFSDPYDLFKVSMNKITDNDILGIEEIVEFKRRFCTIKVVSEYAHLKRIKAIDFFKIFVNNTSYERDDDLVLNYIGEKKRMIVKQIELLYKYKKNNYWNKYIEEYNKCYNNINMKKKDTQSKLQNYINTISKQKKKYIKGKNMFLKKISKFQKPSENNYLYKSNDAENQKNDLNDSIKLKSSSKINNNSRFRLSSSKIRLYQRNFDKFDYKFKLDSPKSKFSSLFSSTKNQTNKLKNDSSFPNNNKSLSFTSKKINLSKSLKNFTKLNKNKNFFSQSIDKILNKNDTSKDISKNSIMSRNIKFNEDNFRSINIEEYKKKLYGKYGFFINEILKLGLGPNIPLRKYMTPLNNDVDVCKQINAMESTDNKKKGVNFENQIRKMRYEFLRITEL